MQNGLTVDDLNEWIQDDVHQIESDESDNTHEDEEREIPSDAPPKVKDLEAIKCFDVCIRWSQENNIDLSKELVLREIQEEAVRKSLNKSQKQTLINQFFK